MAIANQIETASLSPSSRRLVRLMQRINFGCIQELIIRQGEPCFDPPPRVYRDVKFGADNAQRPELALSVFVLKKQVIELFSEFSELGDGVVLWLEVRHGLPFRMRVEERLEPRFEY